LQLLISLLLPELFARLRQDSSCTLVGKVNGRDDPQALSSTFTEKDGRADFQVLGAVHEAEFNVTLVSRAQQVTIHLKHLGRLANDTAMDNCLIVCFYSSSMMQNDNLSIEIVGRLRV